MPARPLHALWGRGDVPPVEWFIGADRRRARHELRGAARPRHAAAVVSVHDLTPLHHPELCNAATLAYPGLIRRALGARRVGPHRLGLRRRRGRRGLRGRPRPRPRGRRPAFPTSRPSTRREAAATLAPAAARRERARTAWPSGPPSRARTCPAWCARSTRWPPATPTSPSCWPGHRGGARRRWPRPSAASPARDRIVRTGWVERARPGRAARRGPPSSPTRRSTRGSASRPLQAMRAGVPVVATRAGSLPEVLGDGALLVDPGDHDGLVEALDAVPGGRGTAAPARRGRRRLVRPVLVGAVRRRPRGALPRRGGRPWLSRAAIGAPRRRAAPAPGARAASAPTPAASSAAWRSAPGRVTEVDVTLLASRAARPPGRRPAGRVRQAGARLAAAGTAPDAGLGPRAVAMPPRVRRRALGLAGRTDARGGPAGSHLVVTVHDVAWRRHPEATTPRGARWHEAALRRARDSEAALVVPSRLVAADLAAFGVDAGAHHRRAGVVPTTCPGPTRRRRTRCSAAWGARRVPPHRGHARAAQERGPPRARLPPGAPLAARPVARS